MQKNTGCISLHFIHPSSTAYPEYSSYIRDHRLIFMRSQINYVIISGKQSFLISRSQENDPVILWEQHLLFWDNDIIDSRFKENKFNKLVILGKRSKHNVWMYGLLSTAVYEGHIKERKLRMKICFAFRE